MDEHKKIDLGEWRDSPWPIVPRTPTSRRFLSPILMGILGTLSLHALVMQSLPFGKAQTRKRTGTLESAFARLNIQSDAETGFVLINLPAIVNSQQVAASSAVTWLPKLRKLEVKALIVVDPPALLETLALSEEQPSIWSTYGRRVGRCGRYYICSRRRHSLWIV